jgi:hypothetical protein
MSGKLFGASRGGFRWWWTAGVVLGALTWDGSLHAQGPLPATTFASAQAATAPAVPTAAAPAAEGDAEGAVVPAGCATCGGGLGLRAPEFASPTGCASCGGGCTSCGGGSCPGPGRRPCDCCCQSDSGCGRFLCGVYQCICCPDPCYEGHWNALADSSFFQEGARPVTQLDLRYEHAWHMPQPDKGEFFFARADGNAAAKGPTPINNVSSVNATSYREFHMVNEVAVGAFSTFVDTPYRQVSPDDYRGASGFADIEIGTKTMLLDCELLQFSIGMNTFVPSGNFGKGLGTGHVSLEPVGLMSIKITPETYLQTELAYRIPIGGDAAFQGPVFHYHVSLNQTLWRCGHDLQLIGTAELNGWEFYGGAFTGPPAAAGVRGSPLGVAVGGAGDVLNMGPGIRFVICEKIDFGVAGAIAVTDGSLGDEYLQAEFRWRF